MPYRCRTGDRAELGRFSLHRSDNAKSHARLKRRELVTLAVGRDRRVISISVSTRLPTTRKCHTQVGERTGRSRLAVRSGAIRQIRQVGAILVFHVKFLDFGLRGPEVETIV